MAVYCKGGYKTITKGCVEEVRIYVFPSTNRHCCIRIMIVHSPGSVAVALDEEIFPFYRAEFRVINR